LGNAPSGDHLRPIVAALRRCTLSPMSGPDLTIIVSTYDRADWLAVSLRSILASAAFAEIHGITTRVLVVDDGSPTDASRRVCERLGVDYLLNPENDGRKTPSVTRVLGLANADSPYVAFFDDDDVMLPRWIPLHVAALRAGHDVCSTAFWWTDEDLVIQRRIVPMPATMGDLLAGRVSVTTGSLMRTPLAHETTWDPDLENVMEYAAWMEMMFRGRAFHLITEPTFLYRRHRKNTSDQLGERDRILRLELQERYRQLILARDGALPRATPRWRRAAWRMKWALRQRLGDPFGVQESLAVPGRAEPER
jgi:glycosyltransferase involved in cell wall biosynthesis